MIHHSTFNSQIKLGDRVSISTLTQSFSQAMKLAGLEPDSGHTSATFHEQRSLSERLYREQGLNTRLLLGHKSQKTTDRYHDNRGSDWVTLAV